MMLLTQITLEGEVHSRARRRAADLGISLAEYVRGLLARDLATPEAKGDVCFVLDLGRSTGSDVACNQDAMIGRAFRSRASKSRTQGPHPERKSKP
jgi:hypothetical protein